MWNTSFLREHSALSWLLFNFKIFVNKTWTLRPSFQISILQMVKKKHFLNSFKDFYVAFECNITSLLFTQSKKEVQLRQ